LIGRRVLPLSAALLLASCVEQAPPLDFGDPTALGRPSEIDGINAYVVAPRAGAGITSPVLEVEIVAYVTSQPEPLRVLIGPRNGAVQRAEASGEPGPGQRFRAPVALVHGVNRIEVRIEDERRARFRRLDFELLYDGTAPGLSFQLLAPPPGQAGCAGAAPLAAEVTAATSVCIRGRATAGAGATVASARVVGSGEASAIPGDDGTFEVAVDLALDQPQTLEIEVSDDRGRSTRGQALVTQDATPPSITVTSPAGGVIETDEGTLVLEGQASDASGISSISLESSRGSVQQVPLASPWTTSVQLEPGLNELTLTAVDRAGNQATATVQARRSRIITLRAPAEGQGSTQLALDRKALASLLTEEQQKTIAVTTVELRPAIVAALQAIQRPEQFGIDTGAWGPAEKNMSRLLNMTPDTADLQGTSVEELLSLGAAVGLPPGRMLSDLLARGLTETFLGTDTLADVILSRVIATHPNATLDAQGNPVLPINLYDVFQDLTTLGPRFGPTGQHPGFLSGPTESRVLEAGFLLGVPVKTNLRQYDGVDASGDTKASLFRLEGDKVLELDFTSSQFSMVGLADEPSVNLRVLINEHPTFLPAGTSQLANPDPDASGFFRGDGPVWNIQPWLVERIVAEGAYRQYARLHEGTGFKSTLSYDAGSIKNAAVISWDKGWVNINTSGGIGSPPAPQYAWDILLETAQVRIHDGGLAEGTADVAFTLTGLPIGLTADELIEKVKPTLQAQAGELSELIAGGSGLAESKADLFYVPGGSGAGFLFFRGEGDSAGPYLYERPGFFEDEGLTQKASSLTLEGSEDTTHEKVGVREGARYFFEDEAGAVFRLEVVGAKAGEVQVRVRKAGAS
jgi:hypothetical protein